MKTPHRTITDLIADGAAATLPPTINHGLFLPNGAFDRRTGPSFIKCDGLCIEDAPARSHVRHSLCGAGAKLRSLRWVRHPDEIATMRLCASLSDWVMDVYREELKPGRLLAEVDHLVSARLAAEAARRLTGENCVIGRLLTLSGVSSACPHGDGAPNGKVLEHNTVANSTIVTRLNGLSMELSRPWLIGSPDPRLNRFFDCTLAAQQAGIEAAATGSELICGCARGMRSVSSCMTFRRTCLSTSGP